MTPDGVAAEVASRRAGRHLLLLCDFDGTLCGFNSDPTAVRLSAPLSARLGSLARRADTSLGIISGRRLRDVRARLDIADDIYVAGFHGLEIQGAGETFVHPDASAAASAVRAIAALMQPRLPMLSGAFIEDKDLSIALHYRDADPSVRAVAQSLFMEAARDDLDAGRLTLLPGASVLELLPAASWHKGSALDWIRQRVEAKHGPCFTIYIGDDVTDEDAFRAVGPDGISVAASDRVSGGTFRIDGPEAVGRLLDCLDAPEDYRRA